MITLTEYVSIEKQLLLDAQKYFERAEMYLAIGKTAHCAGCLAKAAKKLHKANEFKSSLDGLNASFMNAMINRLFKRIADDILNI